VFGRELLSIVRPLPVDTRGLIYTEGSEEEGMIRSGKVRSRSTDEEYEIKNGYLDLLKSHVGADSVANLTNFLPGAGRGYEPLWRVRSLSLLSGERFPNERELGIIRSIVRPVHGGRYLDLGCSAGLYTRTLARDLDSGDSVGIDISPSMLREADRRASMSETRPSFVRANAANLPFFESSFAGAVCGGSLNEFGNPARVLRETHRILEPGGRLAIMGILSASTRHGRRLQRFLSTGGIRFFDPDELQSLLDHAGFEPDPLQTYGAVFFAGATRRE
jgi:SAM-dependent methyltransferase